jgi:hypothetical protein
MKRSRPSLKFHAVLWGSLLMVGCESTPVSTGNSSSENPSPEIPPSTQVETLPKRPKRDPAAVEAITFADLDLPLDAADDYQPWMLTQRVHDLTGRRVRLSGYMSNGLFQLKNIREFVLMRDLDCCFFGPGATADHLIQVKLAAGTAAVSFTTREIVVEGKLSIAPYVGSDGKTWTVFSIEATQVSEKE